MQPIRIVAALIVAPVVSAVVYAVVAKLDALRFSHGPTSDDVLNTIVGMTVIAVLFEVFILLPAAVFLRRRERFGLNLVVIGLFAWLGLTAGGLILIGQNALSVAITSAQLLALGVPVVLLFTVLVRKGLHV